MSYENVVTCSVCDIDAHDSWTIRNAFCNCAFHKRCLNSGFMSKKKIAPSCSYEDCLGNYWLVTQKEMDDHQAKLTKLENELGESLPQLRQSEDIVEGMVELINQLDPKAYTSIKQQRLVDNLKKVANSSNKHQTLQEVNVAEQENILSPLDECANNLESLNNEQNSIEETKILNNTQTTTNICSLEEHPTLHSSDIHNLHVEKTQINQQSSENLENFKELNDQINSSQEQKRFDEFVNIAEKMQKKISLLEHSIRLDRIEKSVESLNKLMTPAEVNSKNAHEQQKKLVNIGKNLMKKINRLDESVTKLRKNKHKQSKHADRDRIETTLKDFHKQMTQMEVNSKNSYEHLEERWNQLINIDDRKKKLTKKKQKLPKYRDQDRIEITLENLHKLMTQVDVNLKNLNEQQNRDRAQIEITLEDLQKLKAQKEDNFKNLHEQQEQRQNQLVNIGERLVRIENNVEFKETNLLAPAKEHPKTLLQQQRKRWSFMDDY